MKAFELLRSRDKIYKELDLASGKHTESQIIKLMVKYPGLINRPIVFSKNKVYVRKIDLKKIK